MTFADQLPQISKADVDRLLKQAQEQSRMLLEMERSMNSNKDYLNKVSHSSLISVDVITVMR